jgi:phage terminase small subunit
MANTKHGKRKTLTPKQRLFALTYAQIGNATEAYRRSYDVTTTNRQSLSVMAAETLDKPLVRKEIERLLSPHIDVQEILSLHARNARQDEHLPTSQRAVESFEEILGIKAQAQAPSINVAFVINRKDEKGVEVASETPVPAKMVKFKDTDEVIKIINSSDTEDGSTKPSNDDEPDDNG